MNREQIIQIAREVGFQCLLPSEHTAATGCIYDSGDDEITSLLEAFAKLVAEHEREACHALRQTLPNPYDHCQVSAHAYDMAISAYGAAIRARGQA